MRRRRAAWHTIICICRSSCCDVCCTGQLSSSSIKQRALITFRKWTWARGVAPEVACLLMFHWFAERCCQTPLQVRAVETGVPQLPELALQLDHSGDLCRP